MEIRKWEGKGPAWRSISAAEVARKMKEEGTPGGALRQRSHAQNQRVRRLPSGLDAYTPAPFEKLATASASLLYTSKTVSNLVIWSTSWNLLPRWQRRREAPCVFTL